MHVARTRQAVINLACDVESLLPCSYDDGSGSEAGDEEAHEAAAEARVDAPASEDGDSSMDAEVCS